MTTTPAAAPVTAPVPEVAADQIALLLALGGTWTSADGHVVADQDGHHALDPNRLMYRVGVAAWYDAKGEIRETTYWRSHLTVERAAALAAKATTARTPVNLYRPDGL